AVPTSEKPTTSTRVTATDHAAKRRAFLTFRLGLALAAVVVLAALATVYGLFFKSSRHNPAGSVESVNSAAYDYYLRGKLNAGSENRETNESAIKVLEQVVKKNPSFGPEYAELARAYGIKANYFAPEAEKKKLNDDAKFAVEKSLALNPDLAEGHLV